MRSLVPVGVAIASKGNIDITLDALGTVTPLADVTIRTQISGQLTEVAFKKGQAVQESDYLAQIDPRPYFMPSAKRKASSCATKPC